MQIIEFDGLPEGVAIEINNTLVIGTAAPQNQENEKNEVLMTTS